MTEQQLRDYHTHVRGAATFVLLGIMDGPMNAAEILRLYPVDAATVNADIDAIVQQERHKAGGAFEVQTTSR